MAITVAQNLSRPHELLLRDESECDATRLHWLACSVQMRHG
jgi:hypothetical protein